MSKEHKLAKKEAAKRRYQKRIQKKGRKNKGGKPPKK